MRDWQKRFHKIPECIKDQLAQMGDESIIVAGIKRVPASRIRDGTYEHLGICLADEGVQVPEQGVIPDRSLGVWSRRNVDGGSVPLRNLPMIETTYDIEVPNYGDWSKGSHTITWTRPIYQRKYYPAKELSVVASVLAVEPKPDPVYTIMFRLDEILRRGAKSFEDHLFYNLNLLQETAGVAGIHRSDMNAAEWQQTIHVGWEVLPVGKRDSDVAIIMRRTGTSSPDVHERIADRYDFLKSLGAVSYVVGTSGFRRYFGGILSENLVVFENTEYGNAMYIMHENWRENSQLDRLTLLAKAHRDFERIPHRPGWKDRVRVLLGKYRENQSQSPSELA